VSGNPAEPPCHRVPAVRHEGPDAASLNQPDASQHVLTARPLKLSRHCATVGRASPVERQTRAPRTRARQARPAAFPVPRRRSAATANQWRGFSGTSFRYAPLRANRLCRARTPIAPQPTCQRLKKSLKMELEVTSKADVVFENESRGDILNRNKRWCTSPMILVKATTLTDKLKEIQRRRQ